MLLAETLKLCSADLEGLFYHNISHLRIVYNANLPITRFLKQEKKVLKCNVYLVRFILNFYTQKMDYNGRLLTKQ